MNRHAIVLGFLWGCASPTVPVPGIQIGEEGDEEPCRVIVSEVRDLSAPSGTLDLSAETFLGRLSGERRGTLTHAAGREVPLVVMQEPVGAVRWVRREPLYDKAPKGLCTLQSYEVDLDWTFSAGDVAVWTTAEARAWSDRDLSIGVRVRATALEAPAPDAWSGLGDEILVAFTERRTDDGWTGTASWEAFDQGQLIDVATLGTWSTDR